MTLARSLRYPLGLSLVLGLLAAVGWPALHSARQSASRAAIT